MAFYASVFGYEYQGVAFEVFSSSKFWFTLILTNVILIVPVVAYRFYTTVIRSTLSDRVRMKQRLTKSKARRDFHIRRASTFRRSARSMRSGYAFAHQEGFGELITSGINMRDRAGSVQLKDPVTLTNMKRFGDSVKAAGSSSSNILVSPSPSHPNTIHEEKSERILYSEKL